MVSTCNSDTVLPGHIFYVYVYALRYSYVHLLLKRTLRTNHWADYLFKKTSNKLQGHAKPLSYCTCPKARLLVDIQINLNYALYVCEFPLGQLHVSNKRNLRKSSAGCFYFSPLYVFDRFCFQVFTVLRETLPGHLMLP